MSWYFLLWFLSVKTLTAVKSFIPQLWIFPVPPSIDDSLSSSDVIVREGANVTLTCRANGSPKPTIKWKRDDNSKISISKGHTGQTYWLPNPFCSFCCEKRMYSHSEIFCRSFISPTVPQRTFLIKLMNIVQYLIIFQ